MKQFIPMCPPMLTKDDDYYTATISHSQIDMSRGHKKRISREDNVTHELITTLHSTSS